MSTFDPYHLTIHASMNRIQIVDLPGLPEDRRGCTAYRLLSAEAITQHIDAVRATLNIPADFPTADLPYALDERLRAPANAAISAAANALVRVYGRDLGCVLATLVRGDPVNREARAEWDASYWEHWAKMRTVILGGGLVSGELGARMLDHTCAALADCGVTSLNVMRSTRLGCEPLIGAARQAAADCARANLFDFGSTRVKRAAGRYAAGTLVELAYLPTIAVSGARGHELFEFMVRTMADAADSGAILASVATYLTADGHPQSPVGLYAELSLLTDNLQTSLERAVGERTGRPVSVRLIHDGTAAAAAFAGLVEQPAAVLMLGTALGIGYVPSGEGLRPLALV